MGNEIDPEKLLTMIRSILPSVARRFARRAKAKENRRVRRGVRMALHYDDLEVTKRDVCRESDHSETVVWRRDADKLNHFMRWCEALTEGMSRQEKLDYVRALLPHNLIGDHAFSHWESHCRRGARSRLPFKESERRRKQGEYDSLRFRLRRALHEQPELLGELNAEIKKRKEPEEPRRLLFGLHDVDTFARDILHPDRWRERHTTEELIKRGRPSGRPRHLESAA